MQNLHHISASLALLAVLVGGVANAQLTCPPPRTYTVDADFDEGTLVNVNHDIPDQLQLGAVTQTRDVLWVAGSGNGTVVLISTAQDKAGMVLGLYRSAPQGRALNPSRTTVDIFGNVWVGNRNETAQIGGVEHGSVIKIGLIRSGTRVDENGQPDANGDYLQGPFDVNNCVDRDNDGLIKTSRGLGDLRAWPDITDGVGGTDGTGHGIVEDADDECILVYQRLADAGAVRHVSVDGNNDVWVGGYPFAQRSFYKLKGDDGAILDSFDSRDFGCGGYGGFIDCNGILWSASRNHKLLRYDPGAGTGVCISMSQSYGLGLDTNGFVWNSQYTNNTITKLDSAGVIQAGFPKSTGGASGDRGVAVTPADNHVWVANSHGTNVSRLDNNGNILKVITVGSTPTGVAVDGQGFVWVTNFGSDNVMRIDPDGGGDNLGAVDLTVGTGAGSTPYNYSDMTGIVLLGAIQLGDWTVIRDGGNDNTPWGPITWNTEDCANPHEPAGTSLKVEVRAADTQAGLSGETFVEVFNGVPFVGVQGRFIEIRVTFNGLQDCELFDTPILCDLTVEATCMGACCDHEGPGGTCTDSVLEEDCVGGQLEFFKGETCADVEARGACEEHTGACCDEVTGTCTDNVLQGDCLGDKVTWYKGESCDNVECVPKDDGIPTVSTWGLVLLVLLVLIGGKVYFARRDTVEA